HDADRLAERASDERQEQNQDNDIGDELGIHGVTPFRLTGPGESADSTSSTSPVRPRTRIGRPASSRPLRRRADQTWPATVTVPRGWRALRTTPAEPVRR